MIYCTPCGAAQINKKVTLGSLYNFSCKTAFLRVLYEWLGTISSPALLVGKMDEESGGGEVEPPLYGDAFKLGAIAAAAPKPSPVFYQFTGLRWRKIVLIPEALACEKAVQLYHFQEV